MQSDQNHIYSSNNSTGSFMQFLSYFKKENIYDYS